MAARPASRRSVTNVMAKECRCCMELLALIRADVRAGLSFKFIQKHSYFVHLHLAGLEFNYIF